MKLQLIITLALSSIASAQQPRPSLQAVKKSTKKEVFKKNEIQQELREQINLKVMTFDTLPRLVLVRPGAETRKPGEIIDGVLPAIAFPDEINGTKPRALRYTGSSDNR